MRQERKMIAERSRSCASRGLVVVDEPLRALEPHLTEKNIRVIVLEQRHWQSPILWMIGNRILVTDQPKQFVDDATATETWVVDVSKLCSLNAEALASRLSKVLRELGLLSKPVRGGISVKIRRRGKPVVEVLED